ncbi:aminoglycoside phosphotransferase (APT) family kinase protein [Kribbella aluminosa]|uniref:Aminoglycoside phosphotransferase (APT) family kinase protein n=1 Tax=Kribbella aluminosa TaxID=416017 RepID=A0ABS4UGD6_9ACTN|nr:aminoglycoside phosphotransferase family protein [Kribbella aluminosa]MBP2350621.1 aminoglycoside phosphotransferase (APT) family kinase protein [Kribbella aluminosa]
MRTLLKEQHPDLADLELKEVDGGWGNQMWRLGEDLALRIPRHDPTSVPLLNEHRWLPEIAARVPLPVPTPVRLGEPSDSFPKSWLVTTWVSGEPADRTPITSAQAADTLAAFLHALHTEAPADAPRTPGRGDGLRGHTDGFEKWADEFAVEDAVREVWADGVAAPAYTGRPVWLHSDLHPANVVVADGTLAGVIDFGDLSHGDPATDLSAAWLLLPDGSVDRFFDAYPVDEPTWRRARAWAAARALSLIAIGSAGEKGLPGGKPTWLPAGHVAMKRVLSGV